MYRLPISFYLFCSFLLEGGTLPSVSGRGQSHSQIVVWEGIQRSLLSLACLVFFLGGEEAIVSSLLPGGDGCCAGNADNSRGVVSGPAKPVKQV